MDKSSQEASLYFSDGLRRIDMVLSYHDVVDEDDEERHEHVREIFEQNLVKAGLQLEVEHKAVRGNTSATLLPPRAN